jgi:hypothetical protein
MHPRVNPEAAWFDVLMTRLCPISGEKKCWMNLLRIKKYTDIYTETLYVQNIYTETVLSTLLQ